MILVTGGSGFLGAHLLVKLCRLYPQVVAIKRPSTRFDYVKRVFELHDAAHLFDRVKWVDVNLFHIYEVEDALEGITEVYHCASEVSFQPGDKDKLITNNVTITANLVNAAMNAGITRFMFASSVSALGRSAQPEVIDETRIWKTDPVNTRYGLSKYQSEMEVWRGYEEGLPVIVVNPSMIMGYCAWNEGTGRMFDKAYEGMKFYTEGITGWVDVNDVAECMIQLMDKNCIGERYILVGENMSYHRMFDMIAHAMNRPVAQKPLNVGMAGWMVKLEKWRSKLSGKPPLITTETLRNATLHCEYVNDKVKKELGYSFTPMQECISKTAEWYLKERL